MLPELTSPLYALIMIAAFGYLLGSIPSGLLIARLMGLGNLRDIGSGNIGATNVLRTGNKAAAFLTLIFDAGKGALAALIAARWLGPDAAQIAGLFAFLGHLYPVWLKFRGGKGVATFIGLVLVLNFPVGAAVCVVWLSIAVMFRYSSLAALAASATAPVWPILLGGTDMTAFAALLAALIWGRHRDNILRLLEGTESRIGAR